MFWVYYYFFNEFKINLKILMSNMVNYIDRYNPHK